MAVKDIGINIRKFRLAAGMSQTDLVALCGIAKPRLSRYENGHILPRVDTIEAIAKALGVEPRDIVGW